ncbi:threonine-phosphate decarboxylase CobD [Sedimentimonas flavescens]|uniref:threonine-phosphate decarboxylase CobD n=1 Tax=Sedimentimonas flavescens TaxID=2851012 RepID=UPI0021A608D6|nr:threonine-phosphate decarboxylase CobD [Sedimentimonas flavescens]MCT2539834.1 threonine-phosphate decarboxylase CobD [Sedimentimonas flavescens]
MRDHGGNIDWAKAHYGGDDWIDLSTGINRVPYPLPALPPEAWTMLPTAEAKARLMSTAQAAFGTKAPGVALAGAQAAIQLIPRLMPPGQARVLAPTYNEHAASLRAAGWSVTEVSALEDLAGADLAIVVNPNNPDGRSHAPEALRALAQQVGQLIVDESFADPTPALSVIADPGPILVLRSFGKFWGLAGVRLGFAFGPEGLIARLSDMAGPWPVSGAAIEIGCAALADADWRRDTIARLEAEVIRIDAMAERAGWSLVGGCALFRTYATPDAASAQKHLARHQIWSRIFPYSDRWIRLGLPGSPAEWERLQSALT